MTDEKRKLKEGEVLPGVPEDIEPILVHFSDTVFNNVKIHLESRFRALEHRLHEFELTQFNVSTLSTLLQRKGIFTHGEFKDLFPKIVNSFGRVRNDGTMDGRVVITKYNWRSEA